MDEDVLTNDQTEKVLHFQELTGIEDINVVRDILIRHQWNLEIAFQERERMNEGSPSLYASNVEQRAPAVINDRFLQHIFVSSRSNNNNGDAGSGMFGIFSYVVNSILNWCMSTASIFVQTLFSIFTERERIVTDPRGDVLKFIDDYTAKYPMHPVFYRGTHAQALNDAKRELKFLLIYLHSETKSQQIVVDQQRITETTNFCRNALSNAEVIDYINKNMIMWACDISSPEGYRVSHSVNARTYPYLVIIVLRDNKMTIVARMEGDCSSSELLSRMRRVVGENERWLNAARHERLERSLTQTLRAQQDFAFEESLKADQEKERKRQKEREDQEKIEREIRELEATEHRRKELKEKLKLELVHSVPSQPSENDENAINIVFKLPNGLRINRRFLKSNSLRDIHNFIFCHPDAPDDFEITQNFPKRVLNCGKFNFDQFTGYESPADVVESTKDQFETKTIAEAGLSNREVLFVSDLDA